MAFNSIALHDLRVQLLIVLPIHHSVVISHVRNLHEILSCLVFNWQGDARNSKIHNQLIKNSMFIRNVFHLFKFNRWGSSSDLEWFQSTTYTLRQIKNTNIFLTCLVKSECWVKTCTASANNNSIELSIFRIAVVHSIDLIIHIGF